jgi:hypothetical protein
MLSTGSNTLSAESVTTLTSGNNYTELGRDLGCALYDFLEC